MWALCLPDKSSGQWATFPSPRKITPVQTGLDKNCCSKKVIFSGHLGIFGGSQLTSQTLLQTWDWFFHFPAGESGLQSGSVCMWEDHMGRGSRASGGSFLVSIWKDRLTKLWWRLCCRHSKDPKPVGTGYEFASCWGYTGTCASVFTHKCWWPASLDPEGRRGAFLFGRRGNLTQIVPTPSQEICCHKSKGRKWLPVLDFWEKMKS